MASHAVVREAAAIDLSRVAKGIMFVAAGALTGATGYAVARVLLGLTPATYEIRQVAIAVHLATVLPAIPLGLWVLLSRKGDATHRMLGRIWAALMVTGAGSALFIRHLNHGQFSWLHLFVPIVFFTLYRAIRQARAGQIAAHKVNMWRLYALALLLPGMFAFLPGRLLWQWLMV
ncbi:DUF2306 domain-containing protein [Sphingomonas kyeonggiensis]|uniref:Putative membrane protein n=1 Tax=Sphingomonas kyeonggiensis TaxID=1268553 RepID=A0A7W6JW07_9SPHN|nr:DUF2306 domain-containing protein [Sphingomonas kyeonggiensis]MBB4099526.1 putative membrane protein [Sphingomonas kyeonggiensis]